MKLKRNQTVLLTGASGGLGTYIARALAAYGLNQRWLRSRVKE